jgi:uncharacterized protein with HEPN domain
MPKNDLIRLFHIRDAIQRTNKFLIGYTFETFINDEKTYYAVLKQIEIVGEAVYNLSNEIKKENPEVEWSKIARSRHIIVHEYDEVDEKVIWKIADYHFDVLLVDILKIIDQLTN